MQPGCLGGKKGKNLLLWANKAGEGWIHAWVGQRGALQQRALEIPAPSTATPPALAAPCMARGQLLSLAGCSGIHGLVGRVLG